MRLRPIALAISCILAVGLLVGAGPTATAEPTSAVPLPTVTPLPEGPIFTGALQDLDARGYDEREFVVGVSSPQVYSYIGKTTRTTARKAPRSPQGSYRSRIIVRAPADPADFNGRVLVEMMNTTALVDLDIAWQQAHDYLMRDGWAYVGITVQQTGIQALGGFTRDRQRYTGAGLNLMTPRASQDAVTGRRDPSIAWDLTSQVGAMISSDSPQNPLAGYDVASLFLTGQSQMAGYAATYINAIHPRHQVFDGFLVAYRGAGATNLQYVAPKDGQVPSTSAAVAHRRLNGGGAPVIALQSESDPLRGPEKGQVRDFTRTIWRADSDAADDRYRLWEVAGASHNDRWGSEQALGILGRDTILSVTTTCDWSAPDGVNAFPMRYAWHSALESLAQWHESAVPPANANRIERTRAGAIKRDEDGNALGGIRLPRIDVPVATFTPISTGGLFCPLTGTQAPFTEAELAQRYPSLDSYVTAVQASVLDNIESGFLLAEDGAELVESARRGPVADAETIQAY
jgi:hypothetical protein